MLIRRVLRRKQKLGYWTWFQMGIVIGAVYECVLVRWRPFGINFFDVWERKHMERDLAKLQTQIDLALKSEKAAMDAADDD